MNEQQDLSIATLPEQLEQLPHQERIRFEVIFSVIRSRGDFVPPPEMREWITRSFGSVEAVRSQTVIKTLNRWTLEGSLFNDLRAHRPVASRVEGDITGFDGDGTDPFCNPLTGTPADTFGRIFGAQSVTASNVAKYDGLHSVVIMKAHNPLDWTEERVSDAFSTAKQWLAEAHRERPAAIYPFIMWNCLPRSGASQQHAHMQVALGEGCAYARPELWRRASAEYRKQHSRLYFDDFYGAHRALGLAGAWGEGAGAIRWLAHLTPVKEKELILIAKSLDETLYSGIYRAIKLYRDTLGVLAFNVALYMPPLNQAQESWQDFPVIVRMVDRGDPQSATSDIGAMELFAQPVVAFDPWKLAAAARAYFPSP